MNTRKPMAILILLCLVMGSIPVLVSADSPDDSDRSLLPDIHTTQAQRPTRDNGPHDYNRRSVSFSAGGSIVTADIYTPTSTGDFPGVVFGVGYTEMALGVLQLNDASNYKWIGQSLASHGYVTMILKYTTTVTNLLDLTSLYEWVNQTVDAVSYLQGQSKVDDERMVLMGHSVGGATAICAAAEDKRVRNVIVFSPAQVPGVFQPSMYDRAEMLSPVPLQVQNGGPLDTGATSAGQVYGTAELPKQRVTIQAGTSEGFTDIGATESATTLPIPWETGGELVVGTHQHNHSLAYSVSFLNYYLDNNDDYYDDFLSENYDETEVLLTNPFFPPTPPPNIEYTWSTEQQSEQLDAVMVGVEADPERVDLAGSAMVTVKGKIVPRGIGWGDSSIKATLNYPDGKEQQENMLLNNSRGLQAGSFEVNFGLERNHDIDDDLEVRVEAVNINGESFLSDVVFIELFSSSQIPTAEIQLETPFGEPGDNIPISVSGSDEDGEVHWYKLVFGDGEVTGWEDLSSNPLTVTHAYTQSGRYEIRLWVKDEHGAQSLPAEADVAVSRKPVAKLKVDSSVEAGKGLKFDGIESSDPDGDDLEYFFDFGDGQNSDWTTSPKVTHTYNEVERYVVTFKVRDEFGVESETVTTVVKAVEEEDTGLAAVLSGSGGSILIIVIILVVVVVVAAVFIMGGKNEEEEDSWDSHRKATVHDEASSTATARQKKKIPTTRPLPPAPAQGKEDDPLPPPFEKQKAAPAQAPAKAELSSRKDFAAPVLTEEQKRKLEEKRKQLQAKESAPAAPAPGAPAPLPTPGTQAPAPPAPQPMVTAPAAPEEKKDDAVAVIDQGELAMDVQLIRCPNCVKEFKVQLPTKKKENGKTICPDCSAKFKFRRKDWQTEPQDKPQEQPSEAGKTEDKPDGETEETLSYPGKPKHHRVGIDVLDFSKK